MLFPTYKFVVSSLAHSVALFPIPSCVRDGHAVGDGGQFEGPERSAWTLPYIVTVNDDHPFGMYVSYPEAYDGHREEDDRLKWYATATTKDIIFSAQVCTYECVDIFPCDTW